MALNLLMKLSKSFQILRTHLSHNYFIFIIPIYFKVTTCIKKLSQSIFYRLCNLTCQITLASSYLSILCRVSVANRKILCPTYLHCCVRDIAYTHIYYFSFILSISFRVYRYDKRILCPKDRHY